MQNFNIFRGFLRKIKRIINFFKIDFSFVFIFVLAYFLGEILLYFYFVLFICLHEFVHFLLAKKLGYMAKKIHLSFFGASLEGFDDFTLQDEIKIVLAGPLFNLGVAVFCYLCFWFYPESYHFLNEVLTANLAIFFFNFLPVYPLDFGRIILACFSKKFKRADAVKITKNISIVFILLLFILFLVSFFFEFNFTLGFVCVNLMSLLFSSSAGTSYKRSLFTHRKLELLKKGLIERNVYLKTGTPRYKLFKFIDDYHYFNFVFLNEECKVTERLSEIEFYKEIGEL